MDATTYALDADGPERRAGAFERYKQDGEQMIHRLRDWEAGDTVFGYDILGESGGTGKTFKRGGEMGDIPAFRKAIQGFDNVPAIGDELGDGKVAFLWSAEIETTRTDPRDLNDPGEPPLKYAELSNVTVLASKTGGD